MCPKPGLGMCSRARPQRASPRSRWCAGGVRLLNCSMAALASSAGAALSKPSQTERTDTELAKLREGWLRLLQASLKSDLWGQVIEAVEGYEALVSEVVRAVPDMRLAQQDIELLHALVSVLRSRCATLMATGEETKDGTEDLACTAVTADDVKAMAVVADDLFVDRERRVLPPVALHLSVSQEMLWDTADDAELNQPVRPGGVLIPRPAPQKGEKHVSIEIIDIGIKNAEFFENPLVRVSVLDPKGTLIEPKQETPVANRQIRYKVEFKTFVHIQSSLDELRRQNAAIFLEFVHFKAKKRKNSTRCWTLLELDELDEQGGPKLLEIYQKPVAATRKSFRLLTAKKLYFNVRLIVT
mmetsp:Transcript_21036/g.67028  ORF Transcript_21036/g.67028 Transcript_21036/m.67028 type:complete len:356 (+) Transcript_21036:35-1102(+)